MTESSDTDPELTDVAGEELAPGRTMACTIPPRSADKYDLFYNKFLEWCKERRVADYTEDVILAFFKEKSRQYKPSTLWAHYSMLKSTLEAYHSIQMRKFRRVFAFIKQQSVGFKSVKSKVFTRENVNRFLREAPDDLYLMWKKLFIFYRHGKCSVQVVGINTFGKMPSAIASYLKLPNPTRYTGHCFRRTWAALSSLKQTCETEVDLGDRIRVPDEVTLIIGLAGGCRRGELHNMKVDDVDDFQTILVVRVPDEKTGTQRTFTVASPKDHDDLDFLDFYRRYAALRPKKTTHRKLFIFYRHGKCSVQVVGINTFGKMPSAIASYLKLPNPTRYTGHCFRRTWAALSSLKQTRETEVDLGDRIRVPDEKGVAEPEFEETENFNSADELVRVKEEVVEDLGPSPTTSEMKIQTRGDTEMGESSEVEEDETLTFFASIAKATNKLPDLLKSEVKLKVASLVGNIEIEYLSQNQNAYADVSSYSENKRKADEDEIDLFFSSVKKSVKKLKSLSQARVRLKVATVVGEAEIGQLQSDQNGNSN